MKIKVLAFALCAIFGLATFASAQDTMMKQNSMQKHHKVMKHRKAKHHRKMKWRRHHRTKHKG